MRRCDAIIRRSVRRYGSACNAKATYYDRALRRNLCAAHAQHCDGATPGDGPSWWESPATIALADRAGTTSLERAA